MANGLYEAVRECRFKQLQFLVESGLSVNQKNTYDQHTLVAALQIEHDVKRNRMLRYLIKHKANCRAMDHKTKRDIFLWACFLGRTTEAQLILNKIEEDFDFHKKDIYGRTALHYATMRGNSQLLSIMCKKMAKYDLTVDVRDCEGFTPFLLAKRLGFEECAEILLHDGLASPYQFDQKQRKMGHVWQDEGMKEHMMNMSHTNDKKVAMYKTLGRLPALRRASFDSNKVKVVKSWKDRKFLANTDVRENPLTHRDISDFSRAASQNPKRSVSLSDLSDIDTMPILNDAFSLQIPRDLMARSSSPPPPARARQNPHHNSHMRTSSSLTIASTDEALRMINLTTPQLTADDTESIHSSGVADTYRSSICESIPELMTILEEQSTHSYRPKAIPPKPKHVAAAHARPNAKSTLAIIFSKDGSKKILKKEVPKVVTKLRNGRLSSIKELTEVKVSSRH